MSWKTRLCWNQISDSFVPKMSEMNEGARGNGCYYCSGDEGGDLLVLHLAISLKCV